MTDKFAGLSLGVDVSQVDAAVKSLDDLSRANNTAGKSFDNFIDAEQVAKQKMKEFNNEVKRQKKEFADVEKAIDPTIGKMRQLQKASVDLDNLWSKGLVPDAEFFNLSSMIETQINALNRSKMALTEEGRAAMANSKAKEAATKDADRFLKSLQEQANAATMTRAELLELKAAQLGVSTQAAPLIAAMNKQTVATNAAGLSAGEYKNAMRMLPAQITDVVTSLASGMPVWLVAVQQGGQIKDSFGGVGNTFKVLLSYLNPVTVGMTAMGIALAGLAKAGYDSYRNISDMKNALIETGGFAASSAAELDRIATKIAETGNATIGTVRDIATELAKSGKYTQDQIRNITRTTAEWSAATGRASSDIIKDFDKIADDPVKGLAKLNEQYNFLEKGQLTYINGIVKTKGETEAVTEATKIFADVMEERMSKIADTATPLEKMWNDIKKWASDAWGWVGDHTLGALNLIIDVVSGTVIQVKMILAKGDEYISNFIASAIKATQSLPGLDDFGKDILSQQESIAKGSKETYEGLAKDLDVINARVEKGEMGYINALKNRRDMEKQYSKETKDAIAEEAKKIEEENRKRNKKDRITKGATEQLDKELYVLKAQLKTLQEHTSINDKISSQRKALWSTEAQIAILQDAQAKRKLTNEEKALLASQQKVLSLAKEKAELGDQIVAQERINKLNDDSMKFIMQMDAASKALNETRSMGTREAERQLQLERIKADYMAKGGGEDDQALNNMLDKQKEYYAQEDQLRGDWLAGAQKAFADYGDSATDMYGNVYDIATNSLNGLSDMMTEFLMTGQANFADFAKSIISQIIKMITQMVIFNSLSGMMGGGGKGFSFANSGWFATGGYTGDGGKYEPAGTVHKGEFVMTKEATKRIGVDNLYRMMRGYANGGMVGGTSSGGGGGGAIMAGGVTIGSIPVSINNGSDPKGMEQGVKMIFKQMIQESCSQGGEVYNYINGKAGA
ncbi:tail tail length tape-measure protein H [Escherichia phage P818]|nr:tail tail length tape-measure protein H [Escherichia phage P818]